MKMDYCSTFKNSTVLCAVLIILTSLIVCSQWAYSGTVAEEMKEALRSFQLLPPDKRSSLETVVDQVLSKYPSLSTDKAQTAREHLSVLLADRFSGRENQTAEQFSVAVDGFRWQLENYARLPGIDADVRASAQSNFNSISEGVHTFVRNTYTDTPENVQIALCDAVDAKIQALKGQIGNYFYPQYLASGGKQLSSVDVFNTLAENPFLKDNAEKYKPIKAIMDNPELGEESKKVHDGFFVEQESFKISSPIERCLSKAFGPSKSAIKTLLPYPEELKERENALNTELVREAKIRRDEFVAARRYEELTRDLVPFDNLTVVDALTLENGDVSAAKPSEGAQQDTVDNRRASETKKPTERNVASGDVVADQSDVKIGFGNLWIIVAVSAAAILFLSLRRHRQCSNGV